MALDAATRLGPYEIVAPLGAGGMGEVYKATDTRLGRTVAIKILPSQFSDHEDMKARFEREARTIAGLSHPNICTLHDVGHEVPLTAPVAPGAPDALDAPGTPVDFLVLEYLEGDTLAARLERGALPLADALPIAIAIADALDKAHRQGIVHRDLKPANVMLTKAGPKLLDFGLAKWTAGEGDSLAAQPTRADITGQGMMLGTLQYMAPEQIEGKEADARTDIFAFGALLYEIITGRKAFQGKSQATLIASIMSRDPRPISEFVAISPPALEHLVERCLQKEPENRWQSAHSLAMQLRWIAYGGAEGAAPVVESANPKRERLLVAALGLLALAAAALAVPAWSFCAAPGPSHRSHTARRSWASANRTSPFHPTGRRSHLSPVPSRTARPRCGSVRCAIWPRAGSRAPTMRPSRSGRPTASRSASWPAACSSACLSRAARC